MMDEKTKGQEGVTTSHNPYNKFPPELMRRFEIYLKNSSTSKSLPIRQIKAGHVGSLITVRGIVTR